jgi:PAS domain S-box-containing protein
MERAESEITRRYAAALAGYLEAGNETALRQAYEAGRRMLAEGAGVLDLVEIYQQCITELSAQVADVDRELVWARSLAFFLESLSAFEMALRGHQEAIAGLRAQNAELAAAKRTIEAEHRRYRDLFEFAPDAYLVTDLKGVIQEANGAAAALLCVPQERLPGLNLTEFFEPASRPAMNQWLAPGGWTGQPRETEQWRILAGAGRTPAPAAVRAAAETEPNGEIRSIRWLIRDITSQRLAEEERSRLLLANAEAQAARQFEFLSDASALLVASLDYESAMAGIARLAVRNIADWCFVHIFEADGSVRRLAGTCSPKLNPPPELLRILDPRRCARAGPLLRHPDPLALKSVSLEWLEKFADGEEELELMKAAGFRSAILAPCTIQGRFVGSVTVLTSESGRIYNSTDLALMASLARRCALVIENARLYREVISERDRAAKANAAKDEFLAILSHELRNPLMPVMGWTRIFKNHPAIARDPVLREGALSLDRNARNIARLVDDCLDLARISQGKIQMTREEIDLNKVILAAVEAVREMAWEKKLSLLVELSSAPLWVWGDRTRLQQVAMNLLVNAIKYTGRGGHISVRSSQLQGEAELEVSDTGIGIEAVHLEKIFEPFRQGAGSWLSAKPGLGLGLAISRQIVQLHDGRIWAESPGTGRGSSFRIRLALITPCEELTKASSDRRSAPLPARRILVVEDAPDIATVMKLQIEAMGHTVFTAPDGASAIEKVKKLRPDLIISDIKMPGMDGFTFIRRVRALEEASATPSIALSGLGMRNDIDNALKAGFDAYLSKPVDTDELERWIDRLTSAPKRQPGV